ncbi:MAG: bifunctional phosphopantothenoylcysteine decarboxylase/phosphopantothenate synthase [Erythrobacter sp.]
MRILLIVGGGIAAYKSCELVRLIRKGGADVTCVVTNGGQQFVTPMTLAALSENQVYTSLFDLKNEAEMGHIQLSREADLVVVCPATADLMAKMATGIADDLATTLILATDKPVMVVPAMNVRMWEHAATQRNVQTLRDADVRVLHPDEGAMACGEFGYGRLPEPEAIWASIAQELGLADPSVLGEPAQNTPADLVEEALEPEEESEEETGFASGLGGLLSAIIPRSSTPKRSAEEIETEYLDTPESELPEENAELPVPDASSPLLASKGSAGAAPPTDPEAINHEMKAGGDAPEPIAGDNQPVRVSEDLADVTGDGIDIPADHKPLAGKHMLITAGPTWEAIDPVRYIGNRSSGRQGFSIAAAAAAMGAKVTLVAGPVWLKTPAGVDRIDVESAAQMQDAVKASLPADIAVMVAAVADWKPKEFQGEKIKKRGAAPPALQLTENPDILANLSASDKRPKLLVGFAAETNDVLKHAAAKRKRKVTDWIVANDVSGDVMGGGHNRVHIISQSGTESLDEMPKLDVAIALVERMALALEAKD